MVAKIIVCNLCHCIDRFSTVFIFLKCFYIAGRQNFRWISKEKVCLQTFVHIFTWTRHWLWSYGSCQLVIIEQIYRKANRKLKHLPITYIWGHSKCRNLFPIATIMIQLLFQGYLFISVLISQNSDLINLINQSIKNDLNSRNPVHVR